MSEALLVANILHRIGFGALIVFGVLGAVALGLVWVAGGRGSMSSIEARVTGLGLLASCSLLSGGALVEGVCTGDVFFALRKGGGRVTINESPGWYWANVVALGVLSVGLVAGVLVSAFRVFRRPPTAAPYET